VIGHDVALLYPAFPLLRKRAENRSQFPAQLSEQDLAAALGDEDHVVLALPFVWFRLSYSSIGDPFRVLGGSRKGASSIDPRNCQTSDASPAQPGGLPSH